MEFSHELALSIIQSNKPYPVNFDEAWQWIGYSSKQKAKEKLTRNFVKEIDFEVFTQMVVNSTGKGSQGGRPAEQIFLTIDCFKSFGMMAGTEKGREIRQYFLKCERIAKKAVQEKSDNNLELEIKKLELELMNAKKSYLETSQAILASTSPAMLAFLRGDGPLPTQIQYRDRYVDPQTGQEVGSSEGRSLTQLLTDAGLNPKSTSDRTKVKNILRSHGLDYDKKQKWSTASYLREYSVLPDEVYQQALRIVIEELAAHSQPNLFVHQFQQTCLPPGKEKPKLSN